MTTTRVRVRRGEAAAAGGTVGAGAEVLLVCRVPDDPAFLRRVRERAALGRVRFRLVVPAAALGGDEALARSEHLTAWPGEDLAFVVARRRLARALRALRDLDVVGEVGVPDPSAALDEVLRPGVAVDEVLLWDDRAVRREMPALARRVRRAHAVPVHVAAADPAAFSDRGSALRVARDQRPTPPPGPRWRS